jgi:hypothetical protein
MKPENWGQSSVGSKKACIYAYSRVDGIYSLLVLDDYIAYSAVQLFVYNIFKIRT